MIDLRRRTVLGWLAVGGSAVGLGARALLRSLPQGHHFLDPTAWLQRVPLSGFGKAASHAVSAVAASPLAVSWDEMRTSAGFISDECYENSLRPALGVFAVDCGGRRALSEVLRAARGPPSSPRRIGAA